MGDIIKFISGGWQKWLAYLGVACVIFAAGAYSGYQYRDGQQAKKEVAAIVHQVETKDVNQGIADQTGVKVEAQKEKVRIVYKTIEKKVIEYVEKNPDARAPIGPDWVRLHDAAASGQSLADSTGKPVDPLYPSAEAEQPGSK